MRIALLGAGTVGGGVIEIVDSAVPSLEVVKILTLPNTYEDPRVTYDIKDIVEDPTIDCVVEAMGGLEPAHSFIMRCLNAGKSVVTANKAVVAAYLPEFSQAASKAGVGFFVEASSGGGIPWIAAIEKARRTDTITQISGILNGTSNYIIYRMATLGASFDEVLKEAQALGYAEADPSADIDGIDVVNKCIISTTLAFNTLCRRDIPVMGIRNLAKEDLEAFGAMGYGVRLMARATQDGQGYAAAVEPVLVPAASLEANVPDNFNLATLVGNFVGPLKFFGQGAGALPTGDAIVQDLLDCAAGQKPVYPREECLAWKPELLTSSYLVRTQAQDLLPEGAQVQESGLVLLDGLTAVAAAGLCQKLLSQDPTTFMAALATQD